jgi:hypothetical protein
LFDCCAALIKIMLIAYYYYYYYYYLSFFVQIIIKKIKFIYNSLLKVKIQQFNCQEHNQDDLKSEFSFMVPLIIEFSFMFTLLINVGNIVTEKQTKMKVIKSYFLIFF